MNENERMRNALTEILNLAYTITGDSDMSDAKIPLDWLIAKCKEGLESQEEPNGGLKAVRAKLVDVFREYIRMAMKATGDAGISILMFSKDVSNLGDSLTEEDIGTIEDKN